MSTLAVRQKNIPRIKGEDGQAILEMLLVILILVPLLFGGIELARGVAVRHALDGGTGLAVRALSLDPTAWDWALEIVMQGVEENIMGESGVGTPALQVYDSSGALLTPGALAALPFGTPFRLEAQLSFTPELPLIPAQTILVRVSHWGIVERYP
jgi:hypothetical protein